MKIQLLNAFLISMFLYVSTKGCFSSRPEEVGPQEKTAERTPLEFRTDPQEQARKEPENEEVPKETILPDSTQEREIFEEKKEIFFTEDTFFQVQMPKIDLLLVVDSSLAMQPFGFSVEKALLSFLHTFVRNVQDFQIAKLNLIPPLQGSFSLPVLSPRSTDLEKKLPSYSTVSIEKDSSSTFLEAITSSLSPPLFVPGTEHASFFRTDAVLLILIATAQDDSSTSLPSFYANLFQQRKGKQPFPNISSFLVSGGKEGCSVEQRSALPSKRLLEWSSFFPPEYSFPLCAFSPQFSFWFPPEKGFFSRWNLSRTPREETLEVWIQSRLIPKHNSLGQLQWLYHERVNQIEIFVPVQHQEKISVRYSPF